MPLNLIDDIGLFKKENLPTNKLGLIDDIGLFKTEKPITNKLGLIDDIGLLATQPSVIPQYQTSPEDIQRLNKIDNLIKQGYSPVEAKRMYLRQTRQPARTEQLKVPLGELAGISPAGIGTETYKMATQPVYMPPEPSRVQLKDWVKEPTGMNKTKAFISLAMKYPSQGLAGWSEYGRKYAMERPEQSLADVMSSPEGIKYPHETKLKWFAENKQAQEKAVMSATEVIKSGKTLGEFSREHLLIPDPQFRTVMDNALVNFAQEMPYIGVAGSPGEIADFISNPLNALLGQAVELGSIGAIRGALTMTKSTNPFAQKLGNLLLTEVSAKPGIISQTELANEYTKAGVRNPFEKPIEAVKKGIYGVEKTIEKTHLENVLNNIEKATTPELKKDIAFTEVARIINKGSPEWHPETQVNTEFLRNLGSGGGATETAMKSPEFQKLLDTAPAGIKISIEQIIPKANISPITQVAGAGITRITPEKVEEITQPHKIVGIDADTGKPIVKMGVEPIISEVSKITEPVKIITPSIVEKVGQYKVIKSGITAEDIELKPEQTKEIPKVAMKLGDRIYSYKYGEQGIFNHSDIAQKHNLFNKKGLIPGFIDKNGDFIYQYKEDIPPTMPPVTPTITPVEQLPAKEGIPTENIMYHGTTAKFEQFERGNDIGIHFGTKEQAIDRLAFKAGGKKGGRIIEANVELKNPLNLEDDANDWSNPQMVLSVLNGAVENMPDYYNFTLKELSGLKGKNINIIRDFLQKKGYDWIVYKNYGEMKGRHTGATEEEIEREMEENYSTIVFDKSKIKITPKMQEITKELINMGVEVKGNIVKLYRGGNVSPAKLRQLRYGDFLSTVKEGKDIVGNAGASEYGKTIVELELPIKDIQIVNGEIQYKGISKSLEGGIRYTQKIYKAVNDVWGSNYTAKEIDKMPFNEIFENAGMGLRDGKKEFINLMISEGKTVPANVLAEYPALQKEVEPELQGIAKKPYKEKIYEESIKKFGVGASLKDQSYILPNGKIIGGWGIHDVVAKDILSRMGVDIKGKSGYEITSLFYKYNPAIRIRGQGTELNVEIGKYVTKDAFDTLENKLRGKTRIHYDININGNIVESGNNVYDLLNSKKYTIIETEYPELQKEVKPYQWAIRKKDGDIIKGDFNKYTNHADMMVKLKINPDDIESAGFYYPSENKYATQTKETDRLKRIELIKGKITKEVKPAGIPKENLQNIADKITTMYNVPKIDIKVSDLSAEGQAAYTTWKIKGGKINNPKHITIYEWDKIKNYPSEIIHKISHELAHHIENIKRGSLEHNNRHGDLEDDIAIFLSKEKPAITEPIEKETKGEMELPITEIEKPKEEVEFGIGIPPPKVIREAMNFAGSPNILPEEKISGFKKWLTFWVGTKKERFQVLAGDKEKGTAWFNTVRRMEYDFNSVKAMVQRRNREIFKGLPIPIREHIHDIAKGISKDESGEIIGGGLIPSGIIKDKNVKVGQLLTDGRIVGSEVDTGEYQTYRYFDTLKDYEELIKKYPQSKIVFDKLLALNEQIDKTKLGTELPAFSREVMKMQYDIKTTHPEDFRYVPSVRKEERLFTKIGNLFKSYTASGRKYKTGILAETGQEDKDLLKTLTSKQNEFAWENLFNNTVGDILTTILEPIIPKKGIKPGFIEVNLNRPKLKKILELKKDILKANGIDYENISKYQYPMNIEKEFGLQKQQKFSPEIQTVIDNLNKNTNKIVGYILSNYLIRPSTAMRNATSGLLQYNLRTLTHFYEGIFNRGFSPALQDVKALGRVFLPSVWKELPKEILGLNFFSDIPENIKIMDLALVPFRTVETYFKRASFDADLNIFANKKFNELLKDNKIKSDQRQQFIKDYRINYFQDLFNIMADNSNSVTFDYGDKPYILQKISNTIGRGFVPFPNYYYHKMRMYAEYSPLTLKGINPQNYKNKVSKTLAGLTMFIISGAIALKVANERKEKLKELELKKLPYEFDTTGRIKVYADDTVERWLRVYDLPFLGDTLYSVEVLQKQAGIDDWIRDSLSMGPIFNTIAMFMGLKTKYTQGKPISSIAGEQATGYIPFGAYTNYLRILIDKTKRQTYSKDYNAFQDFINPIINIIPGISKTLEPSIGRIGEEKGQERKYDIPAETMKLFFLNVKSVDKTEFEQYVREQFTEGKVTKRIRKRLKEQRKNQ